MDHISFSSLCELQWEVFAVDGGLLILNVMYLASISFCFFWLLVLWYVMYANFVCFCSEVLFPFEGLSFLG